jgi:hypothetical protein
MPCRPEQYTKAMLINVLDVKLDPIASEVPMISSSVKWYALLSGAISQAALILKWIISRGRN